MKIAIMQPYFFPYIGYFQLINAVDKFVIYDNIKYTKKGWINRNRFLQNGDAQLFSIPLKKDSDYLDVNARIISSEFNRKKLLNQIIESYRKAPYFEQVMPIFEDSVMNSESNLFFYILHSLRRIVDYIGLKTEFICSSNLPIAHGLQAQEKVIAICENLKAVTYINAIGGQDLYSKNAFLKKGIELFFIKTKTIEYKQFGNNFVPSLSILDVMMFNSTAQIKEYLDNYELITN